MAPLQRFNLLYRLLWLGGEHLTAAQGLTTILFYFHLETTEQTYLDCSVELRERNSMTSLASFDIASATSATPSPIVSQGRWHALVEPSPQLPWQLFFHWAGYRLLSRWWRDKCYNYVNSVQPKCFCRLNIAGWKAPSLALVQQSLLHRSACVLSFVSITCDFCRTEFNREISKDTGICVKYLNKGQCNT